MKTYSAKPTDVTRLWHVLDASKTPLGRLSTVAARLLLGKDKPSFTNHVDVGDFVIVVNAGLLVVTGNKQANKTYYRHSGFPGGLYKRTLSESSPVNVVEHAIRGMLPDNKLRKDRLSRLRIFEGPEHTHKGQNPQEFDIPRKAHR